MGKKTNNPDTEGHVKEWQDRARVVMETKEKVDGTGSPKQSPTAEDVKDVEEKSGNIEMDEGKDASY